MLEGGIKTHIIQQSEHKSSVSRANTCKHKFKIARQQKEKNKLTNDIFQTPIIVHLLIEMNAFLKVMHIVHLNIKFFMIC